MISAFAGMLTHSPKRRSPNCKPGMTKGDRETSSTDVAWLENIVNVIDRPELEQRNRSNSEIVSGFELLSSNRKS